MPEASRSLNKPKSTINNWVKASKAKKLSNIGKNQRELSEIELELARVKRELAKVKMECDILRRTSQRSQCKIHHGMTDTVIKNLAVYAKTDKPFFMSINFAKNHQSNLPSQC